jgi:hypothetical protein
MHGSLIRSVRGPISPRISPVSALETRRLHALAREKAVDRFTVNAQHASHAHGVEPAVVNQAPNGFRMDAELVGDVANTDEVVGLMLRRWHYAPTYNRSRRIASPNSRTDTDPSNFALIRPSRPTRNVHGSPGRCHSRTQRFCPLLGLLSV